MREIHISELLLQSISAGDRSNASAGRVVLCVTDIALRLYETSKVHDERDDADDGDA